MARKTSKTSGTKTASSPAPTSSPANSIRSKKTQPLSAAAGKKIAFGDDSDSENEDKEQVKEAKPVELPKKKVAVAEPEDDSDEDDDDAPEAVSIIDLKNKAKEQLKVAKEESISKKLEAKERQSKGRKVNLEKQEKLVATKSAKQAIDLSIFEEAERIEQFRKAKEAKEQAKKRNHIVLETEDFDTGVSKKKTVKSRKIGGFTVVPLDATLVKQKLIAPAVAEFQRSQTFGDRINRSYATLFMTQAKDGAPPKFAKSATKSRK
ncbi:UNVERIFIED_CONTAM: hypothetical protein HDU68_001341 [Siphonaria sp. JEL0065]|nr:hypothetical protein HDU68_001341 [Siphonaria sp. JEL0065]